MPQEIHVSRHPLVRHKMALLRSKFTEPKKFRELVHELSLLLFFEATYDLAVAPLTVETPLGSSLGEEVTETIGLMPILRAGLGMADAILDAIPKGRVWHMGIYRDEETLKPVIYYNNPPAQNDIDLAIVLDPMLATGGSAVAAVDVVKDYWSASRIKFLGLIAAPEGVRTLHSVHPDVTIHLAAVDSHLNQNGYIVPGLGDAGDRQFGTA